jgi:DNA-binding LacI/PurR family transcriptional regulator
MAEFAQLCFSDVSAIGTIRSLQNARLRVPAEVSGWDSMTFTPRSFTLPVLLPRLAVD